MKRFVATLALLGVLGSSLPQAQAQDYYGGYPQQEQYPVLKKVIIGGVMFGAGFLAGRLSAPQQPQYPAYPQGGYGGYRPQQGHGHGGGYGGGHNGGHGYGRSINFQPGQVRYGH